MRILEKPQIEQKKALERKKEVDEGMKLAKTVDNLRKVKSEEEVSLRKFRDESLKAIKDEIDSKVVERDSLLIEVGILQKQRIEAQAPVDLTQEWKKIESDKKLIENTRRDLLDRETQISVKEIALIDLDKRVKLVETKEKDAEVHLTQAKLNYDKTEEIRSLIEDKKKQSEVEIAGRLQKCLVIEQDLISREYVVNQKKDEIAKEQKDILEKGTRLIEREASIDAKTRELFEKEEALKERDALTSRYHLEASKNYEISETIKAETVKLKEDTERDAINRSRILAERERDLSYKEHDFLLEKEKVENDKKDIEKEKLHIASQQETLRQAWINIKKLQK